MAAFNKIHEFGNHLLLGNHDLGTDTINCFLIAAADAPSASASTKYVANKASPTAAEVNEIAVAGGYSTGKDTVNTLTELTGTASTGKWKVGSASKVSWSATGTAFPVFRYAGIYNDSMATPGDEVADGMIGWWDYGGNVTLGAGESFTVNFANDRLFTLNSKN